MSTPIDVQQLTKRFGDFAAVDDVSFTAPAGAVTALLGPSGSGKSTVLRMIAGLEIPTAGRIFMGDEELTAKSVQDRGVGFVFQHYALFRHMTVAQNVEFGLRVRKESAASRKARVAELLELVQLANFAGRYPDQLSGGQRQRVALARALAPRPEVLLLDEPFGALDAKVRKELRDWLRRLHDEVEVTTVFVTHDQEEALEVADEIVVINDGRIEQIGSPDDLYDRPANDFVMRFLGPVTQLGGHLVRPHDLLLSDEPIDGAEEAMVNRVLHLGFEVRVELVLHGGEEVTAQVTRAEADELELGQGDIVWVRSPVSKERVSASSTPPEGH